VGHAEPDNRSKKPVAAQRLRLAVNEIPAMMRIAIAIGMLILVLG
jgi:hypothetical protein